MNKSASFPRVCDDGEEAGATADGAAGGSGGGDIRGVQFAGCFMHAVVVCENGEEAGGTADGAAGGADIRGGGTCFGSMRQHTSAYVSIRQRQM